MGRAQRKSTVHELCTGHSARRRKKKRGPHNPRRTYDNNNILGECRGERNEAWYRVTAADAEAATYVKRVYVEYL